MTRQRDDQLLNRNAARALPAGRRQRGLGAMAPTGQAEVAKRLAIDRIRRDPRHLPTRLPEDPNVFGSAFVVDLAAGRLGPPPGAQAGGPQPPIAPELPPGSFTWHDGHDTLELALPRPGGAVWQLRLRRVRPESFPLLQRGFRWVQERPYNR